MPVINIDSCKPFLPELARWISEKFYESNDILKMAEVTVLLPYRRAARELQKEFLLLAEGQAVICPRLRAIGDSDDAEILVRSNNPSQVEKLTSIPPAIGKTRRRLLLADEIICWKETRKEHISYDIALKLADGLAQFLDEVQREQCCFDNLEKIVTPELAGHWQITLDFLAIISQRWPEILRKEGKIDPVERRNRIIDLQAEIWRTSPPPNPIIAAGTTGSLKATRNLLKSLLTLPEGWLVLYGHEEYDPDNLPDIHHQMPFKILLDELGVNQLVLT